MTTQMKELYFQKPPYPWTRLGYTYDWGPAKSPVGLSEFVVFKGSTVGVRKVYTNEEYFQAMGLAR